METKRWYIIGIDSNQERRLECEALFHIRTFSLLDEIPEKENLNCAIISTSPMTHADIIKSCLELDLHVFTELNLTDKGYEDNIALAKQKEKVLFMSSTFIYRKEIEYIKRRVKESGFRGTYRHHVGQYLPDWHPWESYKDYFIGKKETNGCREIMAVELPWLIDTFGEVKSYHSLHKRVTGLEIDYDDCYQILLEHESGVIGILTIDVVTPKMERKFEMWQENLYISWDGTPDTLSEYDPDKKELTGVSLYDGYHRQEGYNHSIVEDAYYEEINNFIDVIAGNDNPRYSFEKDKEVLELIGCIEERENS